MKSAHQGMRYDASDPMNWARDRRIFGQGAVRSRGVVIARVRFYDLTQMLLAQCDDVINASSPTTPARQSGLQRASSGCKNT